MAALQTGHLEALAAAHEEITKLCETQEELARQVGKPKWPDTSVTDELKTSYGDRIRARIGVGGRREAAAEGRYVRQTGGRGQYGHVKMEVHPLPTADHEDMHEISTDQLEAWVKQISDSRAKWSFDKERRLLFINKIVGGKIAREYIPAVQKGIEETLGSGVLAGYPVVDLQATLVDGESPPDEELLNGHETDGPTAGASTPEELVRATAARLAEAGYALPEEIEVAKEDVHFRLPKEVAKA